MSEMKLGEIAAKIDAHLRRFESDPVINKKEPGYRGSLYYNAGSWRAGSYVRVQYVSYQGGTNIKRDDALKYLAWLDAGNNGTHWSAMRRLAGER